MSVMRCYLYILVLSLTLCACGDGSTTEARIENARALLADARKSDGLVKQYSQREAIAELKKVIKEDGSNLDASLLLGTAFFEMGEWEDAGNWLTKALRVGGNSATILPVLAQILLNTEEYDKLDSLPFDDLDPEGRSTVQAAKAISLLARDRPGLATELIDAALSNDPRSPFAEVAGARVAMEVESYDEAQKQLTDIVKRYPDYAPAWNLLGDVESARGKPQAAATAYQRVIDLSGENHSTSMNELLMKIYSGNPMPAAVYADAVVLDDPSLLEDDSLNFLKGLSLVQWPDRLYDARRCFNWAIDKSDAYPQSLYYLAAIDLELGVSGLEPDFSEKALSSAYEFLRYFPDSVAGIKLAAKIELGRGSYKRVEEVLRPLVYRKSDDIEALNLLARALLAQGKNQKGIEILTKLVELQPESIDARARLAAAYLSEEAGGLDVVASSNLLVEGPDTGEAETVETQDRLQPLVTNQADRARELNLQIGRGAVESLENEQILSNQAELLPGLITDESRRGVTDAGLDSEQLGIRALQDILSIYPGYQQADILIILRHLRQRRVFDAIASAQAHRARNPSSATAYSLLGRAYLANEERDRARVAFENALALRPGDPDSGNGLADLELQKGNYDAARDYYREVLKHDPGHTRTWMRLAASYAREGKEQDMIGVLEEASKADPRALEPRLARVRYYLAKGNPDEATLLLNAFTEDERNLPKTMEVVAAVDITAGRFDQALETIDRLLRVHPEAAQYHYMKAKAYAGVGDQKRIITAIERAVELDSDHFYAKLATARLALQSGRETEFKELLAELQRVAPDNLDVLELEARLAQSDGQPTVASRLLRNIFSKNPTSESLIAYTAQRHVLGETSEAIGLLEGWIERHPDSVAVREKLAAFYARSGRADDAILQYRDILKIEPGNAAAWNNLAWHILEHHPEEALEYAEKAARIQSNSSAILDTLAMAQLNNNLITEAMRSIERARSLDPESSELRSHEARIKAAEAGQSAAIEKLPVLLAGDARQSSRAEVGGF